MARPKKVGEPLPPTQSEINSKNMRASWETSYEARLGALNHSKPENSVRALRLRLGLSQGAFAEAIGFSASNRQRIASFECGLVPPPDRIKKMRELAENFGVEWDFKPSA